MKFTSFCSVCTCVCSYYMCLCMHALMPTSTILSESVNGHTICDFNMDTDKAHSCALSNWHCYCIWLLQPVQIGAGSWSGPPDPRPLVLTFLIPSTIEQTLYLHLRW